MTRFKGPKSDSLHTAREKFFARCETGGSICPCCDKFGEYYDRVLNAGMARSVLWLYHQGRRFVHVPSTAPHHVTNSREFGKLRLWGLAQQQRNPKDPDKYRRGWWRITPLGRLFVKQEAVVPARLIEYNNEPLLWYGGDMTIRAALTTDFDYDELMRTSGKIAGKLTPDP